MLHKSEIALRHLLSRLQYIKDIMQRLISDYLRLTIIARHGTLQESKEVLEHSGSTQIAQLLQMGTTLRKSCAIFFKD